MANLYQAIQGLIQLIQYIIIARILLSWFPNIDWWKQPFKLINDIAEPILAPFRRLIPPIGGLDLSPIVLLLIVIPMIQHLILQIFRNLV